MGEIWLDLFQLFFSNCIINRIIKYFLLFVFFYDVLFFYIDKVIGVIIILRMIDVIIWVNKVEWMHFRFMLYTCSFGGTRAWSVNIIVEVFGYWSMPVIFMNYLFFFWIFIDKQWVSERVCFQFTIIMHQ